MRIKVKSSVLFGFLQRFVRGFGRHSAGLAQSLSGFRLVSVSARTCAGQQGISQHKMKSSVVLRNFFAAAVLLLSPWMVAAAEPVGKVLFAIGDARLAADGTRVKKDDTIAAGQVVVTGSNGHVHLRFVDDAFVSVRPNSRLQVEQYVYDEREPKNNRVRFSLSQGVARLITGKAGQSAKDNFRLNTPVAAIGIRGTDFLVQARDTVTRVAVQQGAIVASPFSDHCARDAFGPCGGGLAAQLVGSLSGSYLEVTPDSKPVLQTLAPGQHKGIFGFPRPEEPMVNTPTLRAPSAEVFSKTLYWGRWSDQGVIPAGHELLGKNDALFLYRAEGPLSMPQGGEFSFSPIEAVGYARTTSGELKPASIVAPTLTLNFNNQTYNTAFTWATDERNVKMRGSGSISDAGQFVPRASSSNMTISGGLNNTGDEAAYVFMRRLSGDDAYGMIRFHK